ISAIGSGGFGTVFKVEHRLNKRIYAVKRVRYEDEKNKSFALREVKTLSKLCSIFVVKYYHSWHECNHIYIQMEFCSQTFGTILKDKNQVFGRQSSEPMNRYEYYICCEILRVLLECLQYLHELTPPVIHRDLKPNNILIPSNNSFIKLGDFGLATDQERNDMSHTPGVGTPGYVAPEGFHGKYTIISDIYSLAMIALQLFDLYDMYV
ncbi:unnamed protein product, partial [Medioppia subpectinata]